MRAKKSHFIRRHGRRAHAGDRRERRVQLVQHIFARQVELVPFQQRIKPMRTGSTHNAHTSTAVLLSARGWTISAVEP